MTTTMKTKLPSRSVRVRSSTALWTYYRRGDRERGGRCSLGGTDAGSDIAAAGIGAGVGYDAHKLIQSQAGMVRWRNALLLLAKKP
jgi:hypothetical protein